VKTMLLIARRELAATMLSPLGFVVAALMLALDGLFFNVFALATTERRLSADILAQFFYLLSGTTVVASVLISMRLIAEEHQNQTIVLLLTSPVKDVQIVLGKFLGAFAFLALLTLMTFYMPLLIMVHGKVSLGHLLAGYLGLLLIGSASLAIGVFGSALSKSQIMAGFVSAAMVVALLMVFHLARIAQKPLDGIFSALALHNVHFRTFMFGSIHSKDIVYYLSVTVFFLFAATRMLESRRWR
jgi:ABC-2 type transport system permease protein